MDIFLVLIIILISFIQSIFGVGVLLFGTPFLIIMDHSFINALSILLPISIAINFLQIKKHYIYIDFIFYKRFLLIAIPMVVLFLSVGVTEKFNIRLLIGLLLIIISIKSYSSTVAHLMKFIYKYEWVSLLITGIVHGLTNLGGALLSAMIYGQETEKHKIRVTIALCYLTFAVVQMITIFFLFEKFNFSIISNFIYIIIGIIIFALSEKYIYKKIESEKYSDILSLLLLITGLLLTIKFI
jgi:uncharacterized protein